MLFTRCPECETTFRVTDETLKKASGQVRCGRCASVFNAYAELHDPAAKTFEPESAKARAAAAPPAATPTAPASPPAVSTPMVSTPSASVPAAPAPAASTIGSSSPSPSAATAAPPGAADAEGDTPAAAPSLTPLPAWPAEVSTADSAAESIGASSVADIVAEAKLAAAEEEAEAAAAEQNADLSATDVDRVLAAHLAAPLQRSFYRWPARPAADGDASTERKWKIAAAVAAGLLVVQFIHHFRTDIAAHPTFGPWLAGTYGAFGVELTPSWDVRQYQIIDWIATAEPNARGLGSLKITARIQNRGPKRQPYPAVQLRLKDRWEEAVGSRMFTPAEYLPRETPHDQLMSPGETTRAEIEVVDPGPDAYGFELDVCIEVEASLVTCGTDEVFL